MKRLLLASTLILAGFGQASAEGWLAVVNKSRPLCQAAEDFVQIERMAFEYDLRSSPDLEKRAIEFATRKCATVLEAGPHHVRVERTETFPVDETRSVLLACVKVGDTPCRWTTASILVRYEPVTTEYAEQLSREAIYTCRRLIDNAAKYDLRWKTGPTLTQFKHDKTPEGYVVASGDAAEAQNSIGNWMRVSYDCEIDPMTKKAVRVQMFEGRLKIKDALTGVPMEMKGP
jgi:hypothetical protein